MLLHAVESLRRSTSLSQDGFLLGVPSSDAPSVLDVLPVLNSLSICKLSVLCRCHSSGWADITKASVVPCPLGAD